MDREEQWRHELINKLAVHFYEMERSRPGDTRLFLEGQAHRHGKKHAKKLRRYFRAYWKAQKQVQQQAPDVQGPAVRQQDGADAVAAIRATLGGRRDP